MIKWREAYERVRPTDSFQSFFNNKKITDFRYIAFTQQQLSLTPLTPSAAAAGGLPGVAAGPLQMNFPAGAIILGVTAAAYQAQQLIAGATVLSYAPSNSEGRRDLFALAFQYTSDETLTANGLVCAEALLGSGLDTIFPAREIVIPPSQSILITAASLVALGGQNLFAHVVFHTMVPRVTG
jgi:hypothetical protein